MNLVLLDLTVKMEVRYHKEIQERLGPRDHPVHQDQM